MISIRIHGRGGQGNVLAANLLAAAAFADGYCVQAFPNFGAERRGAPVMAFVRLDRRPILRRCQVRTPDFLIVQDESLLHGGDLHRGLRDGGGILINSRKDAGTFGFGDSYRVEAIPATGLAQEVLGRPIPNTALIAAFAALTGIVSFRALEQALERRFGGELLAANRTLIARAAERVSRGAWGKSDA